MVIVSSHVIKTHIPASDLLNRWHMTQNTWLEVYLVHYVRKSHRNLLAQESKRLSSIRIPFSFNKNKSFYSGCLKNRNNILNTHSLALRVTADLSIIFLLLLSH